MRRKRVENAPRFQKDRICVSIIDRLIDERIRRTSQRTTDCDDRPMCIERNVWHCCSGMTSIFLVFRDRCQLSALAYVLGQARGGVGEGGGNALSSPPLVAITQAFCIETH